MNNLITLIDSLTTFPLWADIIFLLLAVAIGIAILKPRSIGIVIFIITALVGFVMLVVGGAFLFIASIIEKMDD
jgi:hypothetical protein